jgi:hypothetical protein
MSDITELLNALEHGDPHVASQLLPLVSVAGLVVKLACAGQ